MPGPWEAFNEGFGQSFNAGMQAYNSPEMMLFRMYKKKPEDFKKFMDFQRETKGPSLSDVLLQMQMQQMGIGAPQSSSELRPGEIKVRDKKSGQIGAIPANEFDPNLYDRI